MNTNPGIHSLVAVARRHRRSIVQGSAVLAVACSSPRASSSGSGPVDAATSSGMSPGSDGGTQPSGASASSGSSSGAKSESSGGSGSSGSSSGSSSGGSASDGSMDSSSGSSGSVSTCSSSLSSRVRVTAIDVGTAYDYNEVDNNGPNLGLTPLAISPLPAGGSRLGFLGADGNVHVATLDANDQLVAGSVFSLTGYDFQDIYADESGGVALISRPALGSTLNSNCGNINNLCGLVANYPTLASCYDMYLVRFDGTSETWATELTDTTPTVPAYGTSATSGGNVVFIWSEYAHNGRIAFDGSNYGAYFGAAVTVPGQSCVGPSTLTTGVNIHQGDRMKVVSVSGVVQSSGFDWGCSHSGYERVIWDSRASRYVPVCKNDLADGSKSGRIALAPNFTSNAIDPVDLYYSDLGSVLLAGGGGYWIAASDIRAGQTANSNGLADVDLWHFGITGSSVTSANVPDKNLLTVSDSANDRAPHLAAYGSSLMVLAWEESTATGDLAQNDPNRKMSIQVLDSTTGMAPAGSTTTSAGPLQVSVLGSRYQDFRAFPDGSVAYPAPGSSSTQIHILRVLPCN